MSFCFITVVKIFCDGNYCETVNFITLEAFMVPVLFKIQVRFKAT